MFGLHECCWFGFLSPLKKLFEPTSFVKKLSKPKTFVNRQPNPPNVLGNTSKFTKTNASRNYVNIINVNGFNSTLSLCSTSNSSSFDDSGDTVDHVQNLKSVPQLNGVESCFSLPSHQVVLTSVRILPVDP